MTYDEIRVLSIYLNNNSIFDTELGLLHMTDDPKIIEQQALFKTLSGSIIQMFIRIGFDYVGNHPVNRLLSKRDNCKIEIQHDFKDKDGNKLNFIESFKIKQLLDVEHNMNYQFFMPKLKKAIDDNFGGEMGIKKILRDTAMERRADAFIDLYEDLKQIKLDANSIL